LQSVHPDQIDLMLEVGVHEVLVEIQQVSGEVVGIQTNGDHVNPASGDEKCVVWMHIPEEELKLMAHVLPQALCTNLQRQELRMYQI